MKRRVRLGSGLDPQKLADTVKQARDTFEQFPGVTVDAHGVDEGWIHAVPLVEQDDDGPAQMIGWLVIFGYPFGEAPASKFARVGIIPPEGYKFADWRENMAASVRLPTDTPPDAIAELIIALARNLHHTSHEQHVEIALEYGR